MHKTLTGFDVVSSASSQAGTVTANTPTALAAAPAAFYVEISADLDNSDRIYVAFDASATPANAPYQLEAGDAVRIEVDNASKVYVNATASGQKWRAAIL